jgi:quinol monooxygenase YgiN
MEAVMIRKMVELKVKPGELGAVESALREYVHAVRKHEPLTELQAFRRGTEPVFLQVIGHPDAESEQRHRRASYTRRFLENLLQHLETDPITTDLTLVA